LAEDVYRQWREKDPENRSLIIVRPTVVFGEGNRGNVYNLLNQINSGAFAMIGNGKNKKSMAYVENLAAFLVKCIESDEKYAVYNYVDTPDFTMNELVSHDRYANNTYVERTIPDFPLPVAEFAGLKIPATGGGWFRLFPVWLQQMLIEKAPQDTKVFLLSPLGFRRLSSWSPWCSKTS
jgi:nucleoside-diphosphate-sugar epimerase